MQQRRVGDGGETRSREDGPTTRRARLIPRPNEQGKIWDIVLRLTPWVLLMVPTLVYLTWASRNSGHAWWPDVTAVLGLTIAAGIWILFGHTLPTRRGIQRPLWQTTIYFIGLLALATTLMTFNEVFLIFAITGFFHAYLLRPWQAGLAGVVITSLIINGMSMRVWASPSDETIAIFLLIVAVQSAAIGAGILISSRSEEEERKREELVGRLEEALHDNAGLHAQLVVQARESGANDERRRLAHEIHDTLAQGLTGIITQLQAAQRAGRGADPHVEQALQLARSSLAEARRSVRALAPEQLATARLPEALKTLTDRWSEDSGTAVRLEVTGDPVSLSPAIEVTLFRVAQESLTNIAKHAAASRVGVTLSYAGPEVLLDVRDDGQGFAEANGDGFGLTSMRQRTRGVGGQVEVESTPGKGTSISARVPAIAPMSADEDDGGDSGHRISAGLGMGQEADG